MRQQHTHAWKAVRKRGNRIRHQCESCRTFGPWENTNPQPRMTRTVLAAKTAIELREIARARGIPRVHQLNKTALIDALLRVA